MATPSPTSGSWSRRCSVGPIGCRWSRSARNGRRSASWAPSGRLSFRTIGYDFVSVLPCALLPGSARDPLPAAHRRSHAGEPFQVLWSGSYNTWSDVRTLVNGLERAMERDPRVRFVSTGGEIPGHDESTYGELVERVARSRFADRFDLRGWLIADELPAVVAGCRSRSPDGEADLRRHPGQQEPRRAVDERRPRRGLQPDRRPGGAAREPPARAHLPGRRRRRPGRADLLGGRSPAGARRHGGTMRGAMRRNT